MPRRRSGAIVVLAAFVLLAMPAAVLAHAELETANPGPDDTLEVAPTELVAVFTEALDGSKSALEVRDAGGTVVASGGADIVAADGVTMTLPLPALPNGTYEVRWTAAAQDGHIERGTYTFIVATAPSPSPTPSPSPSPSSSAALRQSPAASPGAVPSQNAAPSASPGPSDGDSSGSLDPATLLPIVVALGVVVALGAWFMRSRRG